MAIRGNWGRNHQSAGSDYSPEKSKQGHKFQMLHITFLLFFSEYFFRRKYPAICFYLPPNDKNREPATIITQNQTSLMQLAIKEGKLFGRPRNFRLRSDCEIGHKIHTVQGNTSEIFISFSCCNRTLGHKSSNCRRRRGKKRVKRVGHKKGGSFHEKNHARI